MQIASQITEPDCGTLLDTIANNAANAGIVLGGSFTRPVACATTGFDRLLIDGEHGPNDLRSMLAALQAVAPYPAQPVLRIPQGDPALIKQVLEIGATTLLVPVVEAAAQARELVRATRYPPNGVDGVFIGPADLSASMGHLGNPGHPDVKLAIDAAIGRILAAGKAPGILGVDEALARHYIELGARFVAVGVDATLLARTARALAARFCGVR
jgi:4-hydroxy-2-oxoheptanedioate aldolase